MVTRAKHTEQRGHVGNKVQPQKETLQTGEEQSDERKQVGDPVRTAMLWVGRAGGDLLDRELNELAGLER